MHYATVQILYTCTFHFVYTLICDINIKIHIYASLFCDVFFQMQSIQYFMLINMQFY